MFYRDPPQKFTPEEVEYLKNNAPNKSSVELAEELNRPRHSIWTKLNQLGIKPRLLNVPLSEEEQNFIKANLHRSCDQIAKDLNRNPSTVWQFLRRNKLKSIFGLNRHQWNTAELEILRKVCKGKIYYFPKNQTKKGKKRKKILLSEEDWQYLESTINLPRRKIYYMILRIF